MDRKHRWLKRIGWTAAFLATAWIVAAAPAAAATGSDQDLGRALQLFYDGDYARAFPIFQNLKDGDDTLDLLFWTGVSAGRSGNCDAAAENLENVLSRRPDMLRARLELGIAHYNCGNYNDAGNQFDALIAGNPPPEMRNLAQNYRVKIEKAKRRLQWNLRFTQAYQYDDNINSGTTLTAIDQAFENVDGDVIVFNADNLTEKDSNNWITDLIAGVKYDVGAPDGFILKGDLFFNYLYSTESTDFNYSRTKLQGGPWWRGNRDLVKAPIGYVHKRYGGDALSNSFVFNPQVEHFFTDAVSLTGRYDLTLEKYEKEDYDEYGYDNTDHRFSVGPKFYFNEQRYILSGEYGYQIHDADQDLPSFDAHHLTLSFMAAFPTNTEMLIRYRWADRQYDGAWLEYTQDREDTRQSIVGVVAQKFLEHYFVAAEIAYIDNNSNGDVFDFDKTAFTLSVGLNY